MIIMSFFCMDCIGDEIVMEKEESKETERVVLIGASVGNAWNIESLPARLQIDDYIFEFIAKYNPDKSDVIEGILKREENKPSVIIIKQCAAYFRSDLEVYDQELANRYKKLVDVWVKKIGLNNIVPIIATVVPITEKMPFIVNMKRILKKYILLKNIKPYFRSQRLKGILDYNDWVREYAQKNGIIILDLEQAVRVSEENRYLKPELTTDGLHLNEKAYTILDPILMETVRKAVN